MPATNADFDGLVQDLVAAPNSCGARDLPAEI